MADAFKKKNPPELPKNIKKILQDVENFKESHILNGTIALALGERIIYANGFGIADSEANIPCTIQTQYNIASVTKQFIAAALLRVLYDVTPSLETLQDSLQKSLFHYLTSEDFLWDGEIPEWATTVTLHHLLTHTSGIVNYTELDSFWKDLYRSENPSIESLASLFKKEPLKFKPGSRYEYCNSGYFLLGQVIARLSKKSLGQYLAETFFNPLDMKNTSLPAQGTTNTLKKDTTFSNLARGYAYDINHPQGPYTELKRYWPLEIDQGDGGMISTAPDLIKWNNALHKGHVLPVDVLALMMAEYVEIPEYPDTSYCYGVQCNKAFWGTVFRHDGGIPGYCTHLAYIPSLDLTVVSFSNLSFDFTCNQENRDAIKKELSHIEDVIEKQKKYNEIFAERYSDVLKIMQQHTLFQIQDLKSLEEGH